MAPPRRWLVIAGASAITLAAVYLLAVWTTAGQQLENAALRGADESYNRGEAVTADSALDRITIYSLAGMCLAIVLVGLIRRRIDLAIAAAGVIVAGQVVTQVLKRIVLVRPDLLPVGDEFKGNSLPSGHTTIAMTVLFAALIVVPYRWRGVTMVLLLHWAVGIGAYTLTAQWHRLSDTLAADAVALGLACLASWWLARRGAVERFEGKSYVPRTIFVVLVALYVPAGLALGGVLWGVPIARDGFAVAVQEAEWPLYLGASSLATAGSVIAALIFWASWHRLDADHRGADHPADVGREALR